MRPIAALLAAFLTISTAGAEESADLPNPAIDMQAHLRLSAEAATLREGRRVSEEEFLRLSREPDTVVLDARSRQKYDALHVKGAIHLSFPDFTAEALAQAIPSKESRVLIYCNNNFLNAERAFPTKIAPASLNLSTYATLYMYGYCNVYELGPLVAIEESRLEFEGGR